VTSYFDFFITGYNLRSPPPSSPPSDKRDWFECLLTRAAADYKKSVEKWMKKRSRIEGMHDELSRLEYLCGAVVSEFLRFLDFKGVWEQRSWMREALKCASSIIG
jgi:hypothetical protein